MITVAIVCLTALVGIFAPWIAPNDPYETDILNKFAGFSAKYPLGTDNLGRCILSRMLYGIRPTLGLAVLTMIGTIGLGALMGLLAGYFRGIPEEIIMRTVDVMLSFPSQIMVFAVVALLGINVQNVILANVFIKWAWYARMIRTGVMQHRDRNFVQFSRCVGTPERFILFRHLVPSIAADLAVLASLDVGWAIIIGSHLGRPKGVADKFSLKHIVKHVSELLGVEVQFANDCMGEEAAVKAAALQPGEVLLLENLRFYAEEEGKPRGLAEDATDEEKAAAKKAVKESQKEFTKKLASYADCYVNDAFGTAHRAHASTALIAKYFDTNNKMFGYLMEKEVKAVDKILNDIKRPFTAIMGGSKVSSKIEIIENLLNKVDNLIITGGMTYTFTKAMGGQIGLSICEDDKLDLARELMQKAKDKGVNLVLAVDAKIADAFSNDANTKFCPVNEIPDGWEGLDIGPKSEEIFAEVIKNSKTILWNGPTGVFEFENFTHGSRSVGEAIVEATKNGAFSLVGGGDSVACVNKFGLADGVSYVSTGGGALLEAIEGKVLPGIAAIQE